MGLKEVSLAARGVDGPRERPPLVVAVAFLAAAAAIAALAGGIVLYLRQPAAEGEAVASIRFLVGGGVPAALWLVGVLGLVIAWGIWRLREWARTSLILVLALGGLCFGIQVVFGAAGQIFGGEQIVPLLDIAKITGLALARLAATGLVPIVTIYVLVCHEYAFESHPGQRQFVDRAMRYVLLLAALSAILVVALIIVFVAASSWDAVREIGLGPMIFGTVWRPGAIIGTVGQYGMLPMIVGSLLSTFGAVLVGVPLSFLTAILLAEVAPPLVREIVHPAVQLLAGIPSVIYGLFGMVVLAPLIRKVEIAYNSGFGLLNASLILAVMIIPTVTSIAEDALRAVPKEYKHGSLALGTTHWQTIWRVMLPAARSGLVAAVILGIGRALGETMALIMVIGNSIAMPEPLNNNPLSIFLSSARTLTGNIAVEINYAAGVHRSALFFTGLLLFVLIYVVNSLARYLMGERLKS